VHAVSDVSLTVAAGETVALIGESGSGKSTAARLAVRLHDPDSGSVRFDGVELTTLGKEELRRTRAQMAVVFQEPFASLNPRMRVGATIEEPLILHRPELGTTSRQKIVAETLEQVALPAGYAQRYPHQLSGGQQQRVGIARAIVTRPKFVVLDEPTSALDLSVRAQILTLLGGLQAELGLAYLFVSHDIDTVAYIADRIAVMYLGQIVESGPAAAVIADPQHPYSRALMSSTLSPDPRVRRERVLLGSEIPSAVDLPAGCFLHSRCAIGDADCAVAPVPLLPVGGEREVRCLKAPRTTVGIVEPSGAAR
jgi:oligopeptide/dipeptide ABC transporter ATP-binding protein